MLLITLLFLHKLVMRRRTASGAGSGRLPRKNRVGLMGQKVTKQQSDVQYSTFYLLLASLSQALSLNLDSCATIMHKVVCFDPHITITNTYCNLGW